MTARTTWLMSGIGLCAFALAFLVFPVSPASAAGGGDKGGKAEEKKVQKGLGKARTSIQCRKRQILQRCQTERHG